MGSKWIVYTLVLFSSFSNAKELSYKDLEMKDYTAMEKLLNQVSGRNIIDDSVREVRVREALKILLARRNSDGKRSALFSYLQGMLPESYFAVSLHKISESSIQTLNSSSASNVQKTTSLLILQNMLAEIQPQSGDYEVTLKMIRDAKISISESMRSYLRLEDMATSETPSQAAADLLAHAKPATPVVSANDIFD